MKINISLRVYAAYSGRLLYILYLIPCCTPDLQRAPTWKESANEIMERATAVITSMATRACVPN